MCATPESRPAGQAGACYPSMVWGKLWLPLAVAAIAPVGAETDYPLEAHSAAPDGGYNFAQSGEFATRISANNRERQP